MIESYFVGNSAFLNDADCFSISDMNAWKPASDIAQARADGNNGRVWGGMHYPSTIGISDGEGEAMYVNRNSMRRGHRPH